MEKRQLRERELDMFVGRKLNEVYFLLTAYAEKNRKIILPMRYDDTNIDVDDRRICVWIDEDGVILKFTFG